MSQNHAHKRFPDGLVLPVIHLKPKHTSETAIEMADMAMEHGAGGVFLIDHNQATVSDVEHLAEVAHDVSESPLQDNIWIGVNCLGRSALNSLEYFDGLSFINGVWTDNALGWDSFRERVEGNERRIELVGRALQLRESGPNVLHFGGVTHKGRGYIDDLPEATEMVRLAQRHVGVVTTSGRGTGQPIEETRLKAFRDVLDPGNRLAVASGVDVNNVGWHLKYADYLLVSSSIETYPSSGVFDEAKLQELMSVILDAQAATIL